MRALAQLRTQDTLNENRQRPWDAHAARAISIVNELDSTLEVDHYAIKEKLRRVIKDCWDEAKK